MLTRRTALLGFLAAPAIIRTPGLLMPVKRAPVSVMPTIAAFHPRYRIVMENRVHRSVLTGHILAARVDCSGSTRWLVLDERPPTLAARHSGSVACV